MIQIDDDLQEILQALGNKRMSEAWAMQTIIKLVMQNQNMRKTLKVAERLDPQLREDGRYPDVVGNGAAIRPHKHLEQLNNQWDGQKEPPMSLADDAPF